MSVPSGFSGLICIDFNLCFKTRMIKIVTHCREGQLDKAPLKRDPGPGWGGSIHRNTAQASPL